jgi:hypothetical protein
VTNVVLDERNVYFGADDGLYRFARKSGASTRLATDGEIKYVAVDDACVYWTNDAALMTLPK